MALDFNGSNQYLRLTTGVITAAPLTMFGRYRYDTAIGDELENTVLSLTDQDAQQELTIEIGRTGGVDYAIAMANSGGSTGFALSSAPPTINTWQNITGVYASATSRTVYLNAAANVTDVTNLTPSGISDICAGGTLSSSSPIKLFNGALCDLAIWNVALTLPEIQSLNAGFSPLVIRPSALVFYVPAWNSPAIDMKGGVAMTNVNTATSFDHPRVLYPKGATDRRFTTAVVPPTIVTQGGFRTMMGVGT